MFDSTLFTLLLISDSSNSCHHYYAEVKTHLQIPKWTHTYILTNISTFELNKRMIILKGFFVLPFNFISPHDYWHVSWCTHLDKWFWVNRCFFWNNETMSDNIMSSLEKRKYIFPPFNHISEFDRLYSIPSFILNHTRNLSILVWLTIQKIFLNVIS